MVHFMIITQILLRLHVNDNDGYAYLIVKVTCKVISRIDRAFINLLWLHDFMDSKATVLAEQTSNHCPNDPPLGFSLFKPFNMWSKDEKFMDMVGDI